MTSSCICISTIQLQSSQLTHRHLQWVFHSEVSTRYRFLHPYVDGTAVHHRIYTEYYHDNGITYLFSDRGACAFRSSPVGMGIGIWRGEGCYYVECEAKSDIDRLYADLASLLDTSSNGKTSINRDDYSYAKGVSLSNLHERYAMLYYNN